MERKDLSFITPFVEDAERRHTASEQLRIALIGYAKSKPDEFDIHSWEPEKERHIAGVGLPVSDNESFYIHYYAPDYVQEENILDSISLEKITVYANGRLYDSLPRCIFYLSSENSESSDMDVYDGQGCLMAVDQIESLCSDMQRLIIENLQADLQ